MSGIEGPKRPERSGEVRSRRPEEILGDNIAQARAAQAGIIKQLEGSLSPEARQALLARLQLVEQRLAKLTRNEK